MQTRRADLAFALAVVGMTLAAVTILGPAIPRALRVQAVHAVRGRCFR